MSLAGSLGWVQREAVWQHPALLTAHYYPLGRCGSYVPTLPALLSPGVRQAESGMLALADRVQRTTGLPLRVDEANNVACGGQPGVSDTFGAALWALDFLGRAMASQVQGINLHGLPTDPGGYAPLVFTSAGARLAGRLSANPEFYALLLAEQIVGDRALYGGPAVANLNGSVRAFRRPDGGLDVLAVDEAPTGSPAAVVRVALPPHLRDAAVWRLEAPAVTARTGVRLGGRAVSADGSFRGAPSALTVSPGARTLSVPVAADSAALITLRAAGTPDG